MIRRYFFFLLTGAALFSCNSAQKQSETQTDTDVAKAFIRNTLDNNNSEAEKLLLQDKENIDLLKSYDQWYKRQPAAKIDCYKKAEVILENIEPVVADSVEIIYYRNTCEEKSRNKLKLIRTGGK